jgi:ribosomal protein S18 acetylase RimI-like enzyme
VTVALDGDRVVGFYALLNSAIRYRNAPASLTSIQSDRYDIPATYLKVLAVDSECQGRGYGSNLLLHALETAAAAAGLGVTSFAVFLHAVDDAVTRWYAARGFRPLIEGDPKRSMYVRMSDVESTLHQWSHLK